MPVRFFITSGTTADCTVAAQLIEGFQAEYLLADRGYDTDAIRSCTNSRSMQICEAKLSMTRQKIAGILGVFQDFLTQYSGNFDRKDAYWRLLVQLLIFKAVEARMIPVIPPKKNRKQLRDYDEYLYKLRHLVENAFLLLKRWRGIATRYAKNASSFAAAVQIRCIAIWLVIY